MPSDLTAGDLLPQRVNVGLSALIGITGLPGQFSLSLQYAAGGTLEIASLGASVGWGQGWLFPLNSIVSIDISSTVWLASSGATSTVMVLRSRSHGFEGASMGFRG